jgi:hypothetical protein
MLTNTIGVQQVYDSMSIVAVFQISSSKRKLFHVGNGKHIDYSEIAPYRELGYGYFVVIAKEPFTYSFIEKKDMKICHF